MFVLIYLQFILSTNLTTIDSNLKTNYLKQFDVHEEHDIEFKKFNRGYNLFDDEFIACNYKNLKDFVQNNNFFKFSKESNYHFLIKFGYTKINSYLLLSFLTIRDLNFCFKRCFNVCDIKDFYDDESKYWNLNVYKNVSFKDNKKVQNKVEAAFINKRLLSAYKLKTSYHYVEIERTKFGDYELACYKIKPKKIMRNIIYENEIYFIYDIDTILSLFTDFLCVYRYNSKEQKFYNNLIYIIKHDNNIKLSTIDNKKFTLYENRINRLIAKSRKSIHFFFNQFGFQNIERTINNLKILICQKELHMLINNIYDGYEFITEYDYLVDNYKKQRLAKIQNSSIIQRIWDEIKEILNTLNTWQLIDSNNANHNFCRSYRNIKSFKWEPNFKNAFEIYTLENKICIISKKSKVCANFNWEDQVLILKNSEILNDTRIGFNTMVFNSCKIGQNVTIGSNNIIFTNSYIFDNTKIGNNNIFNKNFCFDENFHDYTNSIKLHNKIDQMNNSNVLPNRTYNKIFNINFNEEFCLIGNNNIFGTLVMFSNFFSVGNNNILSRNSRFEKKCKILDNNIIGNGCIFLHPISIYYNTQIDLNIFHPW
ncbi:hypothetical protein GVAV_001481 [Gurleya vavrai]